MFPVRNILSPQPEEPPKAASRRIAASEKKLRTLPNPHLCSRHRCARKARCHDASRTQGASGRRQCGRCCRRRPRTLACGVERREAQRPDGGPRKLAFRGARASGWNSQLHPDKPDRPAVTPRALSAARRASRSQGKPQGVSQTPGASRRSIPPVEGKARPPKHLTDEARLRGEGGSRRREKREGQSEPSPKRTAERCLTPIERHRPPEDNRVPAHSAVRACRIREATR